MSEEQARVKAILRRIHQNRNSEPRAAVEIFQCGNLLVDERKRQVVLSGEQIELTSREFDLLVYFMRNPGQVFRRSELLDQVWGYGHEGYEHTVNTHINRLRAKIENDPARPARIITVWGVGYKFSEEIAA